MIAMSYFTQLFIFTVLLKPLAANWCTFNATGKITVSLEDHIVFQCSGPANHYVQLQEVGNPDTFEELKELYDTLPSNVESLQYEPVDCNSASPQGTANCSKLVHMAVISEMHGKTYRCRSFTLHNTTIAYSEEGEIEVREVIASTNRIIRSTRAVAPTAVVRGVTPSLTTRSTSSSTVHASTPPPTTAGENISAVIGVHGLHSKLTLLLSAALCLFFVLHL